MQHPQQSSPVINAASTQKNQRQFPLLETITSPTIDTAAGAYYLKVLAALWDLSHPKNTQHRKCHIDLHALTCVHAYARAEGVLPTSWEVQ